MKEPKEGLEIHLPLILSPWKMMGIEGMESKE
jgi:hypothetical protein